MSMRSYDVECPTCEHPLVLNAYPDPVVRGAIGVSSSFPAAQLAAYEAASRQIPEHKIYCPNCERVRSVRARRPAPGDHQGPVGGKLPRFKIDLESIEQQRRERHLAKRELRDAHDMLTARLQTMRPVPSASPTEPLTSSEPPVTKRWWQFWRNSA